VNTGITYQGFAPGFSSDDISLFSRPVKVGMPSLIYLRDRRDDPVNSTKGTNTTVDVGVANAIFGSTYLVHPTSASFVS
jgi:hypothetical protein